MFSVLNSPGAADGPIFSENYRRSGAPYRVVEDKAGRCMGRSTVDGASTIESDRGPLPKERLLASQVLILISGPGSALDCAKRRGLPAAV